MFSHPRIRQTKIETKMATVVLQHLTKLYPQKGSSGVRVVKGINLEIAAGEFMILVGPSGCGKTTTLRMIAGLEEISDGTVSIDGRIVNRVPPKDRDIAMVFQNYALYPHMTVFDNMAFGLKLRKFPRAEIETRVQEATAMLGLEGLLERRPKELSGGQRQRVAVGRAIVRKPKVFLFDEPLSNLDAKMRVSMRTEISRLHARLGATMIYVTHDQTEAMTMGDRICVMCDGEIRQVAKPLDLYRRPAGLFVAGFIGSPPMNLFRGRITEFGSDLAFEETNPEGNPLRLQLPPDLTRRAGTHRGRGVILGVRPEDVHELQASAASEARAAYPATLELAEPTGAETFLHLSTGATSFVARVRPDERQSSALRISVCFDLSQAHLFDARDGSVL